MTETQIAIASLVVGGTISAFVTWFFFRKSVNKRLSAYIQFASPVLAGVDDPEVRKALEIRYRGTTIDDLLQLQFVVANEGQRAIRDLIEPLSLVLPKSAKLLEANILHTEPRGREVTIKSTELPDQKTRVEFHFKLLNKNEFFFVKMLINGELDHHNLRFHITVDDLPPTIRPKTQPFQRNQEEPTTGAGAILLGLLPLAVAIATVFGMMTLRNARPELFPGRDGFYWFSWSTLALLITIGGFIYWVTRTLQLIVARGVFGRKHRFHLPARHIEDSISLHDEMLWENIRALPPKQRSRLLREMRMREMRMGPMLDSEAIIKRDEKPED